MSLNSSTVVLSTSFLMTFDEFRDNFTVALQLESY